MFHNNRIKIEERDQKWRQSTVKIEMRLNKLTVAQKLKL